MTDIVESLRALPPREICEHGSQKRKCLVCENLALDAEIERLRDEVEHLREANLENLDHLTKRTHELSRAFEERDRLRAALRRIATAMPLIGGPEAYVMRRIAREVLGDE